MKLYQAILWAIVGISIGYCLTRLIFHETFVLSELISRAWFLSIGVFAGWLLKPEKSKGE